MCLRGTSADPWVGSKGERGEAANLHEAPQHPSERRVSVPGKAAESIQSRGGSLSGKRRGFLQVWQLETHFSFLLFTFLPQIT